MAKLTTFNDDARRRISRVVRDWETGRDPRMAEGIGKQGTGVDWSCLTVKNMTGGNLRRGDVVKIGGLDFTATVEADIRQASATYAVATNDYEPLGVATFAIDSTKTGRVQLAGVATVYATISDSIDRPYLAPGASGKLKPSWWGQFEIVYADQSTNGEKLVLARICATQTPVYKGKTKSTINPGGSGNVGLYYGGSERETVTAFLNWMEGTTSLATNTECLITWFRDEKKWVIIEAEC
jgi:hypothetical protein